MIHFRRTVIVVAWLGALLITGAWIQKNLIIGADLRLFLPTPETNVERLLLEQIGEGPASRLLLLAIDGGNATDLAQTSKALAAAIEKDARFRWVANGDSSREEFPDEWLPYRYLLSPGLDNRILDELYLSEQIKARLRDLSSPAAGAVESVLTRDPTLEIVTLLDAWQPTTQPRLFDDVWFASTRDQALLAVQTKAAGFDPSAQREAVDALQSHFEAVRSQQTLRLTVSGPGAFSTLMQQRIEDEAQWLSGAATIGTLLLILFAYRSVPLLFLGALPLISAALAGLAAVTLLSGTVHGITLAFGFTLIGVAQDYPMHLFSHQHRGLDPHANARMLWPTLATGVASTCIAYISFLFSGVRGLAELAIFTVTGLAIAGLTTRYGLPPLIPENMRDAGAAEWLGRTWDRIASLPNSGFLVSVAAAASLTVLLLSPGPFWQENLSELTPVPRDLINQDTALRKELGAPDVRHLIAIDGATAEDVLRRSERVGNNLEGLIASDGLAAYDHPARYLPSVATQERRRSALPEEKELRRSLDAATDGTPFRPGIFAPFLQDVEKARNLRALTADDLAGTALQSRLESLLLQRDGGWTALITLTGLTDPDQLHRTIGKDPAVTILDLKQASESFVARHRHHVLVSLAIASVLLALVVTYAVRSLQRTRRILTPLIITTLLVVSILHGSGVTLTPFHLIALVLTAGLGLDYSLFFDSASQDPAAQRRTLHAVIVCASSTLLVFTILATSSIPVLRAIGLTVALGVCCNFILALLLARTNRRA
jgi:predicted exporter